MRRLCAFMETVTTLLLVIAIAIIGLTTMAALGISYVIFVCLTFGRFRDGPTKLKGIHNVGFR